MKKMLYPVLPLLLYPCFIFAQFNGPLAEKPGTFEILSRTDYVSSGCVFTKAEVAANLERIVSLVNAMRQNPVLRDIKGFNGRARIYDIGCKPCGYGVPARVSFEFSSFFRNKEGKVVFNTIEPPNWSVIINDPMGHGNSAWFDAGKCYFTVALNKKTLAPGIDLYDGENFILYDPSRPDYWIPVTVEEAFASAREFAAREKDEIAAAYVNEFLDREYAEIPASDRNKPAYFGGNLSRVSVTPGYGGQDSIFPGIMKMNPAYWNKSLSKGAIQLIYFNSVRNTDYLQKQLEECLQHSDVGSGCDLARFELSIDMADIRRLAGLVGK